MARTPEITYRIMSAIKPRNTKPELLLRKALWRRGLRFRVNYTKILGRPDIVFTRAKIVVFCDGDFWHGHNWAIRGISSLEDELAQYSEYWQNKIRSNIKRDAENSQKLEAEGWCVLRFWESDIKKNPESCASLIEAKYRDRLLTLFPTFYS